MNFTSNTLRRTRALSAVGLVALSMLAFACGDPGLDPGSDPGGPGGSPGSGPGNEVGSDTGIGVLLSGSPAAGVRYETQTHEGVTDENGEFFYEPGERVSFHVGATSLGEVEARDIVTPFDLVPGAEVVTGTGPITRALREPVFQRVLSTAMLLESLDADGDWTNGLQISEELTAMLQGVEIDLTQTPRELQSSFAMRRLLVDAAETFDGPRAVVSAASAATHLYDGLEIDPRIYQATSSELDRDLDGTIDRTSTMAYDEAGYLVRHVQDLAGFRPNGEPYQVETWQYDDRGRPIERLRVRGDVDFFTRWTYTATGAVETLKSGETSAGVYELERWQHDHYGNPVLYERDEDGDGSIDAAEAYAYDEEGRLVRSDRIDTDGQVSSAIEREYDEAGRLAAISHIDRDGAVWRVESLRYDEAGRKVREDVTHQSGVNPDVATIFEYDEAGRLTREERDDGNDGTADFARIYAYDAEGNLVYEEADEGADRISVAVTRRFYDAEGRVVRAERDSDGDGRVDSTQRFELDSAGNRLSYEWDRDGNGTPDRVEVAKYDDVGNQLEFERWTNEPGLSTHKYTRTFAPTGWGYLMMQANMTPHQISTDQF